jgi:cyclopropane fatty-acyl-phospholipid synthase-like methyltransferase
MSIEYYNKNAEMYIKDTVTVDMRKLYNVFEKYLNQGDTVLDIGCGSVWY